jgi:hypothetical protein
MVFQVATNKADYLRVLPVRHFRVDDHTVALESASADHLRYDAL